MNIDYPNTNFIILLYEDESYTQHIIDELIKYDVPHVLWNLSQLSLDTTKEPPHYQNIASVFNRTSSSTCTSTYFYSFHGQHYFEMVT